MPIDSRHQIAKKVTKDVGQAENYRYFTAIALLAIGRNSRQTLIQTFFAKDARDALRGNILKLYLAILAVILLVGSVPATTIVVCPSGCNYNIIQKAIDASHAGDTILVQSGTYYENVYVSRELTLRGVDTGKGIPVINAGGSGSVITLYADNITLDGFNVTKSGTCGCGNAGIRIMSNNSTIFGNIAYGNKYGIYCANHIGNRIYQNSLVKNNISAYDGGSNQWYEEVAAASGIKGLANAQEAVGNHYSDFNQPGQGCNDTNGDGICDSPYRIRGGSNVDNYPLTFGNAAP
jgi:parallel beta-helix repeat protein